ncbi:hypothetical protein [Parafrankia discariae]|uniref:hypothetical protein n=1 Tax=Parafrankia discariae TaxID=365528 RepID=UPI000376ABC9|nr:hypothetical protein [Parafrankia discariae]
MTVDDGGQHRVPAVARSVRHLGGQVDRRPAPDTDPVRRRPHREVPTGTGAPGTGVDGSGAGKPGARVAGGRGGVDHPHLEMVAPRAADVPEVLALARLPAEPGGNPPDAHSPDLVPDLTDGAEPARRVMGGALLRRYDGAGGKDGADSEDGRQHHGRDDYG